MLQVNTLTLSCRVCDYVYVFVWWFASYRLVCCFSRAPFRDTNACSDYANASILYIHSMHNRCSESISIAELAEHKLATKKIGKKTHTRNRASIEKANVRKPYFFCSLLSVGHIESRPNAKRITRLTQAHTYTDPSRFFMPFLLPHQI